MTGIESGPSLVLTVVLRRYSELLLLLGPSLGLLGGRDVHLSFF